MTRPTSCSMSTIAIPSATSARMSSRRRPDSLGFIPAAARRGGLPPRGARGRRGWRWVGVVGPARWGPRGPRAPPAATARSTRSTAWTPPKVLLSCRVSSNIRGSDLGEAARLAKLGERHDPAREIDDDREQDGSLEDVAVVLERAQQLGQRGKDRRPEDRADDVRDAADDREDEDLYRLRERKVVGVDRERDVRGEAAGPRGEQRAEDERRELVPAHRDSLARRSDLVLAYRRPRAPSDRTLHAPEDVGDDREREVDVPELGLRRDAIQALATPGDRRREEDDSHDLAERERRDSQVHAAEAEHGEPKRSSERRGRDRAGGERERERRAQVTAEQRRGVRADRHEGGVPERELTRVEREPDRERKQRVNADDRERRRIGGQEVGDRVH